MINKVIIEELIEVFNKFYEATDSKRKQYIEYYKKPIKDYLIIFEILKIPIKNQV